MIARYGIGIDTVDLPAATAKGIVVTNVPDYCIDEVSDHALALILSLVRGVVRLDRSVRTGGWDPDGGAATPPDPGRTLGLVGFGRIARRLAAKAAPWGSRVARPIRTSPADAISEQGSRSATCFGCSPSPTSFRSTLRSRRRTVT